MCSLFTDPLFSLPIPSSAGDKTKPQSFFFDRRRKGVVVGEDVFEKNEKKKKTTSLYRLVNVDSGHSFLAGRYFIYDSYSVPIYTKFPALRYTG